MNEAEALLIKQRSCALLAGKGLKRPKTLAAIKAEKLFAGSPLVTMGRLSVVPLTGEQWEWLAK